MNVEVVERMSRFGEREWNRLTANRYPFLRHEFLRAAEESDCVSADSGWEPRHLALRDDLVPRVAAGGTLVLSGLLTEQVDRVARSFVDAGLDLDRVVRSDRDPEWSAAHLRSAR